jgi:RNase P/RNase MRP subunit p30
MEYADLYLPEKLIGDARRLGWTKFAVTDAKKPSPEVLKAAVIHDNIQKNARKALDKNDIVIVDSQDGKTIREAAKTHEVDIIINCEINPGKDSIRDKNSGIDDVTAKFMAETGISYCINARNILYQSGSKLTQLAGRIMQNTMLCKKYDVPIILSSGAKHPMDCRNPVELANLAKNLGLNHSQSLDAVSRNPIKTIEKAIRRNDPNHIMDGLQVACWGGQKPRPNKKHGWY